MMRTWQPHLESLLLPSPPFCTSIHLLLQRPHIRHPVRPAHPHRFIYRRRYLMTCSLSYAILASLKASPSRALIDRLGFVPPRVWKASSECGPGGWKSSSSRWGTLWASEMFSGWKEPQPVSANLLDLRVPRNNRRLELAGGVGDSGGYEPVQCRCHIFMRLKESSKMQLPSFLAQDSSDLFTSFFPTNWTMP